MNFVEGHGACLACDVVSVVVGETKGNRDIGDFRGDWGRLCFLVIGPSLWQVGFLSLLFFAGWGS